MPGGSSGGMGQGNQVKGVTAISGAKDFSNRLVQAPIGKELFDRKLSDWNDQFWSQQLEFLVEPGAAICNLIAGGHAIAASFFLAGEAAADGCHVNAISEFRFGKPGRGLEPFEEGLSRGPGKRAAEDRLFVTGSLSHQNHFADDRPSADDRLVHVRAECALAQLLDVKR